MASSITVPTEAQIQTPADLARALINVATAAYTDINSGVTGYTGATGDTGATGATGSMVGSGTSGQTIATAITGIIVGTGLSCELVNGKLLIWHP